MDALQAETEQLLHLVVERTKSKKSAKKIRRRTMENYNPSIIWGMHTKEITIQQFNYTEKIVQKVQGNCIGRDVLDFDFADLNEEDCSILQNDCHLAYDENSELFTAILKNKKGDGLKVSGYASAFNDMIVGIRFLDYSRRRICEK
jgi:hypothetical protein